MKLVGIDMGGTFTDSVLLDADTGELWKAKVPTTTRNPHECFLDGVRKVCEAADTDPSEVEFITHGTTIVTNIVVERTGAEVGLVTTEGFRDVLAIGRTKRDDLYDVAWKKPSPLVPRDRRYEIAERTDADGNVLDDVDPGEIDALVERVDDDIECLVVTLLNSYANPANERRVKELLEERTDRHVITSHEILPVFREFGRLSTTVINGYVAPKVFDYLDELQREVNRIGEDVTEPLMATASGGQVPIEDARATPGKLVLSGPANGPEGASFVGDLIGVDDLITFDMGGTSCDVSLIKDGEPSITTDTKIEGYPFYLPVVDINAIAAGGGSIGWVDDAGLLHVGPRSAGADPGPACYGRGGTEPTVTDANLVLERYNPDNFMGGEMVLEKDRAEEAIQEHVADPLGIDVLEAAEGILRITNSRMADAIETITVKRGENPSDYALMSFGGAGPSHAGFMMDEMNISAVICSPFSSVFSAFGMTINPLQFDYQITRTIDDVHGQMDDIVTGFEELRERGRRRLAEVGGDYEEVRLEMSADAKYRGQRWETEIPITERDLEEGDAQAIVERYHDVHEELYTYKQEDQPVLLTNFHLKAVGQFATPSVRRLSTTGRSVGDARRGERAVVFDGERVSTHIYEGSKLEGDHVIDGPAIIEYVDTTVVVPPGKYGVVDEYGNVVLRRGGE